MFWGGVEIQNPHVVTKNTTVGKAYHYLEGMTAPGPYLPIINTTLVVCWKTHHDFTKTANQALTPRPQDRPLWSAKSDQLLTVFVLLGFLFPGQHPICWYIFLPVPVGIFGLPESFATCMRQCTFLSPTRRKQRHPLLSPCFRGHSLRFNFCTMSWVQP